MSNSFRPYWEETYFEIAKVISKRSKDPHTKVGAVLVKDGRVLGVGYNGEPREFTYSFNWFTEEKYNYVIHAELNAIANACSIGANVNCIKLLIQHQIRNVYFLKKYKDFELTEKIANHANINLIYKGEK